MLSPSQRRPYRLPLALSITLFLALAVPPAAAQAVSGAEAVDALTQALQARGLTPAPESGLSLDDYVSVGVSAFGRRRVEFSIGPEGRLVPTDQWRDYHPNYCQARAREARPASSVVSFEVYQNTERHNGRTRNQITVFGRVRDAATGRPAEASEGEASNMTGMDRPDEGWTADALEEAFAKLQTPMGAPEGPCGEVRLEHVAGRRVGDDFVFQAGHQGHGQHLGYVWDFGDGATAEGRSLQRPRHVYSDEGTYPVRVTVYGPGEEVHARTISVRVGPREEADLASCTFTAEVSGAIRGTFEGTATVSFEGDRRSAEVTDLTLEAEGFDLSVGLYPGSHTVGQRERLEGSRAVAGHGADVDAEFAEFFAQDARNYGDYVRVTILESRAIPVSALPPSLLEFTLGMATGGPDRAEAMLADPEARAYLEEQVGDVAVRGTVEGQLTQHAGALLEGGLGHDPSQIQFRAEFDAGSGTFACDPEGFPDRVRSQMEPLREQAGRQ